jgi:hypothetical protein
MLIARSNKRSSATEPGNDAKRRRTDDIQQAPGGNIEKVAEDLKKEAQAVIGTLKQDSDARKEMHLTACVHATGRENEHYQALEKVVDLVDQATDKMAAVVGQRVAFLEREIAVHERELAVHKREMVEIREALNLKKRSGLDSPFNV